MLRAATLEELIDAAALLSTQPLPRGRRVAVLTNAGGLGILCADACEAAGLELPELVAGDARRSWPSCCPREASLANPVDMLGSATAASYEAIVPVVLADPAVDAVIVLFVPPVIAGAEDVAEGDRPDAASRVSTDKPVLAALLAAEGIPATLRRAPAPAALFTYPESAARALGLAAERAEWLRRPAGAVPDVDGIDAAAAARIVSTALAASADALARRPPRRESCSTAYGVPLVDERLAETRRGRGRGCAPSSASRSSSSRPLPERTRRRPAASRSISATTPRCARPPSESARRWSSSRWSTAAPSCSPASSRTRSFGPLVAFGPGGVLAELIGEAGFRIAPLTDVDADELLQPGEGRAARGRLPRSCTVPTRAALADLLHRLSRLAEDLPEVAELDLNPVLAGPGGCVAVDARVRVRRPPEGRLVKTW